MSAYKVQTPGNYPEESIQHTEHGESFKSRKQPNISVKTSVRIYRCIMVVQKAACCRLCKTTVIRLHIPEIYKKEIFNDIFVLTNKGDDTYQKKKAAIF
jgi:hypothetical protein